MSNPQILVGLIDAAQKLKFSVKYFFSKCDQISRKLRIWSHLLKKFLMENFIFCAVRIVLTEMTQTRTGPRNKFDSPEL